MEGQGARGARARGAGRSRSRRRGSAVAFEVEQAREGVGIGDVEVVAGEEAEPASRREEVAEVRLEADRRRFAWTKPTAMSAWSRGVELLAEVGQEGVVLAAGDEAAIVCGLAVGCFGAFR